MIRPLDYSIAVAARPFDRYIPIFVQYAPGADFDASLNNYETL